MISEYGVQHSISYFLIRLLILFDKFGGSQDAEIFTCPEIEVNNNPLTKSLDKSPEKRKEANKFFSLLGDSN